MTRKHVARVHAISAGRFVVHCTCGHVTQAVDDRSYAFTLAEVHAWPDHATVEAHVKGAAA